MFCNNCGNEIANGGAFALRAARLYSKALRLPNMRPIITRKIIIMRSTGMLRIITARHTARR